VGNQRVPGGQQVLLVVRDKQTRQNISGDYEARAINDTITLVFNPDPTQ
jgi:hypothetical protein